MTAQDNPRKNGLSKGQNELIIEKIRSKLVNQGKKSKFIFFN